MSKIFKIRFNTEKEYLACDYCEDDGDLYRYNGDIVCKNCLISLLLKDGVIETQDYDY